MLSSFELIGHKQRALRCAITRARSEAGLSRLPVTEEIAGSNPVGPAKLNFHHPLRVVLFYIQKQTTGKVVCFLELEIGGSFTHRSERLICEVEF